MPPPKTLVFDLGGVIFDSQALPALTSRLEGAPAPEEIRARWDASTAVADFQTGRLSPEAFAAAFLAEWALPIPPENFLALFRAWQGPPFEGAVETLAALRPHFTLACLSNTNALHWSDMISLYDLPALFDRLYASHLLGGVKPEPAVYRKVAEDLGCDPTDMVFFDDSLTNVQAARDTGMAAHQVRGIAELRTTLVDLNVLER